MFKVAITKVGEDTRHHPELVLGEVIEVTAEITVDDNHTNEEQQDVVKGAVYLSKVGNVLYFKEQHSICIKGHWIHEEGIHGKLTETYGMLYRIINEG